MNGVIALGHSSGEITMWTPNMGSTPVVKLLAHPSAPVTGLAISRNGTYMATTGKDSRLKIWDIRSAYKCPDLVKHLVSPIVCTNLLLSYSASSFYTLHSLMHLLPLPVAAKA